MGLNETLGKNLRLLGRSCNRFGERLGKRLDYLCLRFQKLGRSHNGSREQDLVATAFPDND
jgi:hypothetical protein